MNKIILKILFMATLVFAGNLSLLSVEATGEKTGADNTAQDVPEYDSREPGYHKHDGFYFRLMLNPFVGYGYAHSMQNTYSVDRSDFLMNFSFQIGYSLNQHIILTGGIDVGSIPPFVNPLDLFPKAINPQKGSAINNESAALSKYLLGINYYFMPQNIYVTLELTLASMGYSFNNKYLSSVDNGPGIQTSLGKEWWMSKDVGFGLALTLSYNYFPTSRTGEPVISPMQVFTVGLSFSATYN